MLKNKTLYDVLESHYKKEKESEYILHEDSFQVKIPVKNGDMGLSLDDPIESYKNKLEKGDEKWEELSKQLNVLYIFNKNHNPENASKANKLRDSLAKWIENKRKENPDFSK